jgi:trimeric autotransporter adhesin
MAALSNGDLIVGGNFTQNNNGTLLRIVRWNGTAGVPIGTGTNGWVTALAVMPNGDLIAGGAFSTAGGALASSIARWDGSTWSPLGTGMNGIVNAANTEPFIVSPSCVHALPFPRITVSPTAATRF